MNLHRVFYKLNKKRLSNSSLKPGAGGSSLFIPDSQITAFGINSKRLFFAQIFQSKLKRGFSAEQINKHKNLPLCAFVG